MNKEALFDLSYGVYVVSTAVDGKKAGCIVNSIFQVTSDPVTVAISINKDNYTNPCIIKSGKFAISILSEDADSQLIGTFGFKTSKDTDKFADVEYVDVDGIPALTSKASGCLVCDVINTVDCFTHTIIVGQVSDAVKLDKATPMTYAYYHKVIKGKAPKNAPTYIKENPEQSQEKYVCDICGYVYKGSREAFEALPDSYECPICAAKKNKFSLQG